MWKALIRLVEKWACRHKWDKFREIGSWDSGEKDQGKDPHTVEVTMICKECSKIKKIKL